MKTILKTTVTALAGVALSAAAAFGGSHSTIKIAFLEALSGPFAANGTNGLHQFEFAAEKLINEKGGLLGGAKMEIVPFDNKFSPTETLIQLQVAIDQGIRFIAQGNSSSVANAITEAVNKHNKRNPESRVLFLNYAAVDPALTNEKCNFWHFRFDANADIKMDALTDVIAEDESVKKVYIIGQDYSFGKAVAAAAVSNLAAKRPDIEIVGNELHPIGKVKDFTPYARKIIASGADAIITGNWGTDMSGLGKSVVENGYSGPIYTYYAGGSGITATFGAAGKGVIRMVAQGEINPPASQAAADMYSAFQAKYPDGNIDQSRIFNVVDMLGLAIEKAGSADDVVAIASALEGMTYDSLWGGQVYMRPQDHQAIQDIHIHAHTDENITFDYDNSGYGLFTESTVEMAAMDSETSCVMDRP
ncbi:MAG: branched-chain amino acid ABC transporter substrate-binding protein [Pikeienuella sp.]